MPHQDSDIVQAEVEIIDYKKKALCPEGSYAMHSCGQGGQEASFLTRSPQRWVGVGQVPVNWLAD